MTPRDLAVARSRDLTAERERRREEHAELRVALRRLLTPSPVEPSFDAVVAEAKRLVDGERAGR